MNNQVKVTAKEGQVVIASENKPEYGYIRVEAKNTSMENGWIQEQTRSALIRGKVESLKSLGFKEGSTMFGKIYVKESFTPFSPNQKPKINPSTGEIVTNNGSPVYRESYFTSDMNKADELLASDKVESATAEPLAETSKIAASL